MPKRLPSPPPRVQVYQAGNRIERRANRIVVIEEFEYHHEVCPCFQCAHRKNAKESTSRGAEELQEFIRVLFGDKE